MRRTPYEWKSKLSPYLKGFIEERHLAGYHFRIQERWIKQFDQYCFEKGINKEQLTKSLL